MKENLVGSQLMEPETKPVKNWTKIALSAGLGLVLTIGLIFVGYQLGQQKSQPRSNPLPQLSPSPTPNLTTNWKTYKNQQYGFEFKYPPQWSPKAVSYESGRGRGDTAIGFDGVTLKPPESERGNMEISVYAVKNEGLNIRDYFNEKDYGCCGIDIKPTYLGDRIMTSSPVTIDGVEGRKLDDAPEDIPIPSASVTWVIVEKNRRIYVLRVLKDPEENKVAIEEVFDQILSTFKFLD